MVRDIDALRDRYAALGFTMTPVGRHPWGTSTSLAMFEGCLLELMSVYDESLLDVCPAGDFRFGRLIRDHLAEREGISMQALHSDDAEGDAAIVKTRGVACEGTISFGRDVVLPDGRRDRTATTLKILHDPAFPRLSTFICQQHRPDLIYVPTWMAHANRATGIRQVTILSPEPLQPRVRSRFRGLYGADAIVDTACGFAVRTGNGFYMVSDRAGIEAVYGPLPAALADAAPPFCLAIHVRVPDLDRVRPFLAAAGVHVRETPGKLILDEAERHGNVFLVFDAATIDEP